MKFISFSTTIILLLILSSFAFGQSWDQAKGLGFTAGLLKSIGGSADRAAMGNSGGVSLRYGVSPYIMFDLSGAYGAFGPAKQGSHYQEMENAPYRTFLFPVNLTLRATPVNDGSFRPYVTAGGGLLLWKLNDVSAEDKSFLGDQALTWGTNVTDSKEVVLIGGLGLETWLTSGIALDLQGRFSTFLTTDPEDNVGYADNNDMNLEALASLVFYFGYFKDTDKDGIEDKYDADVYHAEDFDGFEDEDGAPEYDNDKDGIPDLQDKAPNEAEDKDGFEDEDGVPDYDNDGDGIKDDSDKCPDEAEDVDGYQDEDGCPDNDNDGDGISDAKDQCPNEAETVNGYKDDDGCPDKKPLPKLEKKGAKLVLKGVNFESGSAALIETSHAILDDVALGLIDNKNVSVEIRGYTDSQGSATSNQRLSKRRAQTVMQYLINKGVDASRMSSAGYGEKDPIATNKTAAGRAENRRIEFFRTK